MLYIVTRKYPKATAMTDRREKYFRGLREHGVDFQFIALNLRNPYPWLQLFYALVFRCFRDDRWFVFGSPHLLILVSIFIFRRKLYHERSEYPPLFPMIRVAWINRILFRWYDHACRRLDGLFVISTALVSHFRDVIGVPKEKITIVNIVCDAREFERQVSNQGGRTGIVYVGSMQLSKDGVDLLIESYAKLVTDEPLVLVGPFHNATSEEALRVRVRELGIDDKVVFTGGKSQAEVRTILQNARLAVLCRPQSEQAKHGFATKLGQYLLSGATVVVTDTGDVSLFLKDGESALVAKPNDTDDFAAKMQWALEHPDESRQIGEKGRNIALVHFNYLTETRKIIDVAAEATKRDL